MDPDVTLVFSVILTCLVQIVSGKSLFDTAALKLALAKIFSHSAQLRWGGPDLSLIRNCQMSLANGSSQIPIREDYPLSQNHTIELDDLKPATEYEIFLSCLETNGKREQSHVNFTTTLGNETVDCTTQQCPGDSGASAGDFVTDSTTELVTGPLELSSGSAPADIALGILFGLMAIIILAVAAYYVLKKARRRQRIQRFLQYRQNNPFPGLEREDDRARIL